MHFLVYQKHLRVVVSWLSIVDRSHGCSFFCRRYAVARATTFSKDRYQQISRTRGWRRWGSLFEAGATGDAISRFCVVLLESSRGQSVRPRALPLPALHDWATEADPFTITELFPFRRFPSWLCPHPGSYKRCRKTTTFELIRDISEWHSKQIAW